MLARGGRLLRGVPAPTSALVFLPDFQLWVAVALSLHAFAGAAGVVLQGQRFLLNRVHIDRRQTVVEHDISRASLDGRRHCACALTAVQLHEVGEVAVPGGVHW